MHQSVTRILPANHVGLKVKPANHSCPGVTSVMSAPRWGPRSVDGQTLNSQPVRCHNACDNCSESRNDGRASGNRDRRLPGPAETVDGAVFLVDAHRSYQAAPLSAAALSAWSHR
jgi:hypothetical protein